MKRKLAAILTVLLSIPLFFFHCISAFAEPLQEVHTEGKRGTVTITYREGGKGNDPVRGAVFTLYKLAEFTAISKDNDAIGTRYQPILPGLIIRENLAEPSAWEMTEEEGRANPPLTLDAQPARFLEAVQKVYRAENLGMPVSGTTDDQGNLIFQDVEPAAYLLAETTSAAHHYASVPCLISVPEMKQAQASGSAGWSYDISVSPKPISSGKLEIRKKIAGNAAERKAFHFIVTFENNDRTGESIPANSDKEQLFCLDASAIAYPYTNTNGQKGSVKSGDTLLISPDETVTIEDIPAGTFYRIREDEAGKSGYVTTSSGDTGHIQRTDVQKAEFLNTRDTDKTGGLVQTGDRKVYLLTGTVLLIAAMLALFYHRKKGGKT
ncbi:MAG: DUF5979 domain-containing protein [Bilifractor sp.]